MRIIDLTHTVREDMPVFPGDGPPELRRVFSMGKDGFRETVLSLYSHTGTHVDAPAHMLCRGAALDELPMSRFMGRAAVIPCGGRITMEEINAFREMADSAEFLIFHTGQEELWGEGEAYLNAPVPDAAAVEYAVKSGKKGVGIDCMSVDFIGGHTPNHKALLAAGLIIVENLCNLNEISGRSVYFMALPLKYAEADGAPVRAAAIWE